VLRYIPIFFSCPVSRECGPSYNLVLFVFVVGTLTDRLFGLSFHIGEWRTATLLAAVFLRHQVPSDFDWIQITTIWEDTQ
jgi:hypothetical protein